MRIWSTATTYPSVSTMQHRCYYKYVTDRCRCNLGANTIAFSVPQKEKLVVARVEMSYGYNKDVDDQRVRTVTPISPLRSEGEGDDADSSSSEDDNDDGMWVQLRCLYGLTYFTQSVLHRCLIFQMRGERRKQ